jgi:hypothetical protein
MDYVSIFGSANGPGNRTHVSAVKGRRANRCTNSPLYQRHYHAAPALRIRPMESYGVGFRSYTEPYFDSCGVFKDAVIAIMATLAKQERIRRSERTKAALAIARARGKVLGRPKTITATPGDVARLRACGHSFRATAGKLGISLRSVQRLAVS